MDDGFGAGITCGVLLSVLFCILAFLYGQQVIQEQAVAAGVACYKADAQGRAKFRWNCKQE